MTKMSINFVTLNLCLGMRNEKALIKDILDSKNLDMML